MKLILTLSVLLLSLSTFAADPPYNEQADAKAEVLRVDAEAKTSNKPALLIFGANWCEDCRALDKSLKSEKNAALMARSFRVLKIDVGRFDRNLDIANQYGDGRNSVIKKGIPAAVVLSPTGEVIYATRAGELADAREMSDSGVYDFFKRAA
jgi:protein disulfide-isomerase